MPPSVIVHSDTDCVNHRDQPPDNLCSLVSSHSPLPLRVSAFRSVGFAGPLFRSRARFLAFRRHISNIGGHVNPSRLPGCSFCRRTRSEFAPFGHRIPILGVSMSGKAVKDGVTESPNRCASCGSHLRSTSTVPLSTAVFSCQCWGAYDAGTHH